LDEPVCTPPTVDEGLRSSGSSTPGESPPSPASTAHPATQPVTAEIDAAPKQRHPDRLAVANSTPPLPDAADSAGWWLCPPCRWLLSTAGAELRFKVEAQHFAYFSHLLCSQKHNGMCPALLCDWIHQMSFVLRTGSCVRGHITCSCLRNDPLRLLSERRLLCSTTISSAQPLWTESENAGSVNRLNVTLLG
jgi:hypothetical protein